MKSLNFHWTTLNSWIKPWAGCIELNSKKYWNCAEFDDENEPWNHKYLNAVGSSSELFRNVKKPYTKALKKFTGSSGVWWRSLIRISFSNKLSLQIAIRSSVQFQLQFINIFITNLRHLNVFSKIFQILTQNLENSLLCTLDFG